MKTIYDKLDSNTIGYLSTTCNQDHFAHASYYNLIGITGLVIVSMFILHNCLKTPEVPTN